MKKFLSFILLVALCCASIFAADVAAKVMIKASLGSEGFSITGNDGVWNPVIALSVNGDVAGASFAIVPLDWGRKIDITTSLWFKPDFDFRTELDGTKDNFELADPFKVQFGTKSSVTFGGVSDILTYASINYSMNLDSYDFVVGYKPKLDTKDSTFYFAGQINHNYKNNMIHVDALAKLDVKNGNASINYMMGEADWTFGDAGLYIKKSSISNFFDCYEEYMFDRRNFSWTGEIVKNTTEPSTYTAGLRYKYYADEAEKTGVYAYGLMRYNTENESKLYYEAEVEAGMSGATLELSASGLKEVHTGIAYLKAEFNYGKNKPSARLSEVYAKMTKALDVNSLYMIINYCDKNVVSILSEPGLYVTQGTTFSVGSAGLDTYARIGLDENFKIKWKLGADSTVSF